MYWTLLIGMHSKYHVMVVGQYDTITLFNFKYHGDEHVVFVFECEDLGKVLLSVPEGTRLHN